MENIVQRIQIPDDHRLKLEIEVPETVPAGPAEVTIYVQPLPTDEERRSLLSFAGCLADSKWIKRGGLAIQRELRDEWD